MALKQSNPTKYNDSLNEQITKGNREEARVFQPQWVNNQTRLNSANVELMRSNLMTYIEKIVASLHKQTNDRLNQTQKESAGWVVFDDPDNILGEIFNEEPIDNPSGKRNNSVSKGKKYQAVFGQCNIANGNAQFVCGKYNSEVENALLIVGCGSTDSKRDNVLVVSEEKGIQLYHNVTIGENLQVDGSTQLNADLRVNANTILDGNTTITENLTVEGTTKVSGVPTEETHVIRKKELDELRSEIGNALHYIGVTTTSLTDGDKTTELYIVGKSDPYPAKAGDVVICKDSNKEFIYDGDTWYDYGDSDNYVLKKIYDADKTAITGNADTSVETDISLHGLKKHIDNIGKNLNVYVTYTNPDPLINDLGGIKASEHTNGFNSVPINELITELLYPYTKPVIDYFTLNPSAGVKEKGVSLTVSGTSVKIIKKSKPISKVVLYKTSDNTTTTLGTSNNPDTTSPVLFSGLNDVLDGNTDTTYTIKVSEEDGTEDVVTAEAAYTFVDPYYFGVINESDNTEDKITESLVKGLTKYVIPKGTKQYDYTTTANQCSVIAYPKYYGVLKSIKDPNGFTQTWTQYGEIKNVTVNNVDYYVYVSGAAAAEHCKYTFSY